MGRGPTRCHRVGERLPNTVFPSWNASYLINATASEGGAVAPESITVPVGGSAAFTLTAEVWQRVVFIATNGTSVEETFDNSSTNVTFLWRSVTGTGAVHVVFAPQTADDPAQTPYAWLAAHQLNSGVSWNEASLRDADSDGFFNWEEYLAGTNPTNAASRFEIIGLSFDQQHRPVLTFTGSATNGVSPPFQMLRAMDMNGPWQLIDENIPRQADGVNIWTDHTSPDQGAVFYCPRVLAPEAP